MFYRLKAFPLPYSWFKKGRKILCAFGTFVQGHIHTHTQRIITSKSEVNKPWAAFWKPHLVTQGKTQGRVSLLNTLRTSTQMWPLNFAQHFTYIVQRPVNWPNEALKPNSVILQEENTRKSNYNCQYLALRDIWQSSPIAWWLPEKLHFYFKLSSCLIIVPVPM